MLRNCKMCTKWTGKFCWYLGPGFWGQYWCRFVTAIWGCPHNQQAGPTKERAENHPLPKPEPEPEPIPKPKKPETIQEVAESLRWYTGDDQKFAEKLIARSIEKWILENIEHKFYWYPRGIKLTWEEKRSDCTDRAMLAQKMLEFVGIKSRRRHGYVDGKMHDWLKTDQYTLFIDGYDSVKLIGEGFW